MDSLQQALLYANDFTIKHSGITKDFKVVSTLECVKYQKEICNLLLQINGNWHYKIHPTGGGWVQVKPPTISQP